MTTYDPDKLYDFPTAFDAFKDGFIIFDVLREKYSSIQDTDDIGISCYLFIINYPLFREIIQNSEDFFHPRFKILPREKKKVKFYPAVLIYDDNPPFISYMTFRDIDGAINYFSDDSYTVLGLITDIPELIEEREVDE